MEHATEFAIIATNLLVVVASILVALVTGADVVKDQNRTIREAIKALVTVNNRKAKDAPNPIPGQEELRLVVDDKDAA